LGDFQPMAQKKHMGYRLPDSQSEPSSPVAVIAFLPLVRLLARAAANQTVHLPDVAILPQDEGDGPARSQSSPLDGENPTYLNQPDPSISSKEGDR
jgi:hypothetical protein